MNARTVRLKKEVRALFWPWCAVMAAGVLIPLPYVSHRLQEALGFMGMFFGIPLLATLPFGNEFQHRTLALLLTQPTGRMEILREKLMVTVAAVVPASVVFFCVWLNPERYVIGGLFIIAATASATFWTLSVKSTMGGLALSAIPVGLFYTIAFGLGINLWDDVPAKTLTLLSIAALGYAVLTLWLGARKLARFQLTGGIAGGDLVMSGPNVMPEALTGWLRYRPTEPVLNLIRKELRLLRALWLIALPVVVYMTFLTVFQLLPDHAQMSYRTLGRVKFALAPLMAMHIMAILAGCLSLGEERASGTHSWHMTLPVPAGRQWLIKLLVAMFMGFFCAVLLPFLVLFGGGNLSFGGPIYFVDPRAAFDWMYTVPVLTLVGFWFACAMNGTMRAAFWFVPATGLIYFAARGGDLMGQQLAMITGTLRDLTVSWFQLSPLAFTSTRFIGLTWLSVLLVAVIQSYWLFRTLPEDSILGMIRRLMPVTLAAFLCGVFLSAGWVVKWQPFSETQEAIEKLHVSGATAQLTVEDLTKVSPLSPFTRRWLRDASISIAPGKVKVHSGYFVTIHLASGLDCRLAVAHYGGRSFNPEVPSCAKKGL